MKLKNIFTVATIERCKDKVLETLFQNFNKKNLR